MALELTRLACNGAEASSIGHASKPWLMSSSASVSPFGKASQPDKPSGIHIKEGIEASRKHSFEQDLPHHSLIFVVQEMTVEDGHAPDDRIGEIHDYVDVAQHWNIHRV